MTKSEHNKNSLLFIINSIFIIKINISFYIYYFFYLFDPIHSYKIYKSYYIDSIKSIIAITNNGIYSFNPDNLEKNNIFAHTFKYEEQKISSMNETKLISACFFLEDNINILFFIVKNYYYIFNTDGILIKEVKEKILNNQIPLLTPYKCIIEENNKYCYFFISFIKNDEKKIVIRKYQYTINTNVLESVRKKEINPHNSLKIADGTNIYNIDCQIITTKDNESILSCFLENNSEELVYMSCSENISNINYYYSKNNGAKYIKSKINKDKSKFLICYINYNDSCECQVFDINEKTYIKIESQIIEKCDIENSSLNLDYNENKNEYLISCFSSPIDFTSVALDENFNKFERNNSETCYFNYNEDSCPLNHLSTIISTSDNYSIYTSCISEDTNFFQKIDIQNQLCNSQIINYLRVNCSDEPTDILISDKNDYTDFVFIHKKSDLLNKIKNMTKEEIVDNISFIINEIEINKTYEILCQDSNVKISPINTNEYEKISTFIDFMTCEDNLRHYYKIPSTSILTVFQIEFIQENSQSLINQLEYAVFDEQKNKLDLSICSNDEIKIYYGISNPSILNISYISHFTDIGVDIFDIKDKFFNDICFPYFEMDSDLILKDRVMDIYHNYTMCDSNCKYEKIDIQNMTIMCRCSIKKKVNTEIEDLTFDKVLVDIFKDSTFGVIQCYKLVFSSQKKNNIGFWIFLFFIILQIPFIINYIIYRNKTMKNYIKEELMKFHYIQGINNPIKRKLIPVRNNDSNNNFVRNYKRKKTDMNALFMNDGQKILCEKNCNIAFKSKKRTIIHNNNYVKIFNSSLLKSDESNNILIQNSTIKIFKIKKRIKKKKNKCNIKKFRKFYFIYDNNINNNNKRYYTFDNYNYKQKPNIISSDIINNEINITFPKINNFKKNNSCIPFLYNMIRIDANNFISNEFLTKYVLYIYDYDEAIKCEKRKFLTIYFIIIALKEKIINTLFFKSPLEIQSLRICLLIFIYSSNFAFNTLFYFSGKISNKYHNNTDNNIFWFTIMNNISICILSTIFSFVIVSILRILTNSKNDILKNFLCEERKMRRNNKYFVNKIKRKKIITNLGKIFKVLKIKILLFFIIELLLLLFFFYFTTAFREVYKKTQTSWLIDCIISLLISIIGEILFSFIITILYTYSIRKKIKFLYYISIFLI